MSDCKITLPVNEPQANFIAKVRNMVEQANGRLDGDENTGKFSINSPLGEVAGSYTLSASEINIIITDKPFLLGCGAIKGILEAQIK